MKYQADVEESNKSFRFLRFVEARMRGLKSRTQLTLIPDTDRSTTHTPHPRPGSFLSQVIAKSKTVVLRIEYSVMWNVGMWWNVECGLWTSTLGPLDSHFRTVEFLGKPHAVYLVYLV